MPNLTTPLVSPEHLAASINTAQRPVLFDVRIGPDAKAAYLTAHLQGAIFADMEGELSGDTSRPSDLGRHPLPPIDTFCAWLTALGVTYTTPVVIYDDQGGANAAARLWWSLRATGHTQVAVLDGGFQAAVAAGFPLESGPGTALGEVSGRTIHLEKEKHHLAEKGPQVPASWALPTVDIDDVDTLRLDPAWKLLDARSAARYRGEIEPIDPIAGRIPGALSVPFTQNLDSQGRFLPKDKLREYYLGILGDTPPDHVIVACGSGVTACHTLLALDIAGLHGARLFVGSYGQWCRTGRPILTGTP